MLHLEIFSKEKDPSCPGSSININTLSFLFERKGLNPLAFLWSLKTTLWQLFAVSIGFKVICLHIENSIFGERLVSYALARSSKYCIRNRATGRWKRRLT